MDSWILKDTNYKESYQLKETLYSTANGYLGVRGSFEEGVPANISSVRGTYINGFYETEEIIYGEKLFGFPDKSQSILNIVDTQEIQIFINNEQFSLFKGEVINYNRELNLKKGIVSRSIKWRSPKGNEVAILFERMVSFTQPELFITKLTITPINFKGDLKIVSVLNGNVSNIQAEDDPRVGTANAKHLSLEKLNIKNNQSNIQLKTHNSNLTVVGGLIHACPNGFKEDILKKESSVAHSFMGELNGEIEITKYAVFTDSRRHKNTLQENIKILNEVSNNNFNYYKTHQEKYLNDFWSNADIEIEGDDDLQQGIRFNLYHLLQSAGKDQWSNVSAKGLSGEGYEGHYFWDTEVYIFPFFLFTNANLAKNLLNYRYSILNAARERAKQMGHTIGALYPWRTIAGEECSPFFPAGTAQYHINVDIAYAILQYFEVTKDDDFILEKGLEMLIEISRLMHHIGNYNSNEEFVINAVTGPDEYTCIVNNNYYTNKLTKYVFENINSIYYEFKEKYLDTVYKLSAKLNFSEKELDNFQKAASKMLLPYNEKLDIHPQDDSFLDKPVWDFENVPKEKYPLLLNYHPLTLYRHQVCKQADTVLAHFLIEDGVKESTLTNDVAYYESITTHDSSLSTCIFSIMSNRIGKYDKAYEYFKDTATLDINDSHHNTKYGIHTACMGGSWMALVFGFAGMRLLNGELSFKPHLYKKWEKISFKIRFKGRLIQCILHKNKFNVNLIEGDSMYVLINNKRVKI